MTAYNYLISNLTDFNTEVDLKNLDIKAKVDDYIATLNEEWNIDIKFDDPHLNPAECYITPPTEEELVQMEIERVEACMADYYDACDLTMRNSESQEMDLFEGTITSLVDNLGVSDGCDAI